MTKVVTSGRTTGGAVGPSEKPLVCGDHCVFFQHSPCEKEGLQGPLAHYARRRPIYTEGDPVSHSYKVVEGAVRTSRILADGHRQILDILLPGDTFGLEIADHYGATAEAVGDVVVLRCPRGCVDKLSDGDHRHDMRAMLSRSLSTAQEHVAMLGHQGARQRIASFLLRLAENQKRSDNEALDIPVGRQDIADYLGLTIETTCRTLTDLKLHHVISTPSRHQIVIRSLTRLGQIAEGDV